jgi:hypothetical protein
MKLNRLSPLLHCLSATSSLLRLSPPPPVCTILVLRLPFGSPHTSDFSCSVQNPVLPSCWLYPGCHVNSNQVSFTFLTSTNVIACFRHRLLALRDFIASSIYSARQYAPSRIKSSFFLIVHHITVSGICSIRWFVNYS